MLAFSLKVFFSSSEVCHFMNWRIKIMIFTVGLMFIIVVVA